MGGVSSSTRGRRLDLRTLFLIYATCLLSVHAQSISREINGRVLDEKGNGIAGVLVIPSGGSFRGWATTSDDGSFQLSTPGIFLSVRHPHRKAELIRISDLAEPVRIQLPEADQTVRKLPACSALPNHGLAWIGGGLRVNPGRSRFIGPVNGDHDSHWYIRSGKDSLHIVEGYAWHAGLPLESILAASQQMSVRSWEFDDIVGLDLSGQTKDGQRWRWMGAPAATAIEYTGATPQAADYFDSIIDSICFSSFKIAGP